VNKAFQPRHYLGDMTVSKKMTEFDLHAWDEWPDVCRAEVAGSTLAIIPMVLLVFHSLA